MNFLNPLYAILITIFAILCVGLTFWIVPAKPVSLRFGTIDGLRGYLAFFVFIHHASIWFTYSQTGNWGAPKSHLYTQLGQASVGFFFMITSFLFYDKLLRNKFSTSRWIDFFINRIFRLSPLYFALMIVIFVLVIILSDGNLHDRPQYIFSCAMRWLSFTIFGSPNINNVSIFKIVSGATWSLPYEWCFYLLLPIIAITTGQKPSWYILLIGLCGLVLAYFTDMQIEIFRMFLGGLIAARLVKNTRFLTFAKKTTASLLVFVCIAGMLLFDTAYAVGPFLLSTIGFSLIAGGTNLFGFLETKISHRLGELAYSIYLLHGIVIYIFIQFFLNENIIAGMSGSEYWFNIAMLVPVLLTLSAITFNFVEKPGIEIGKKMVSRLQNKKGRLPSSDSIKLHIEK